MHALTSKSIKGGKQGGGSICHQVVVNSWKAMYFFTMLNTSHSTAQFPGAFSMLTQPILLTRRKKNSSNDKKDLGMACDTPPLK